MMVFRALVAAGAPGVGIWLLLNLLTPTSALAQATVEVNAGALLPVGQFSTVIPLGDKLDLGQHYQASLLIPIGMKQQWSVRITGGWWTNPLQEESQSFRLTQTVASVGAAYNFLPQSKLQPILSLQPGLFLTGTNLEGTNTRIYAGGTATVQARYRINPFWSVNLQGQYSRIFSRGSVVGGVQDLSYVPMSIGVGYTFARREE